MGVSHQGNAEKAFLHGSRFQQSLFFILRCVSQTRLRMKKELQQCLNRSRKKELLFKKISLKRKWQNIFHAANHVGYPF